MAVLPSDWNERPVQVYDCWPVGVYTSNDIRWSSKVTVRAGGPGAMNPLFTTRNLDARKHIEMRKRAEQRQPYTTRQAHGRHKAGESVMSWAKDGVLCLEYQDGDVVELPLEQCARPGIDPPCWSPPRRGLMDG